MIVSSNNKYYLYGGPSDAILGWPGSGVHGSELFQREEHSIFQAICSDVLSFRFFIMIALLVYS